MSSSLLLVQCLFKLPVIRTSRTFLDTICLIFQQVPLAWSWTSFFETRSKLREVSARLFICAPTQTGESFWWGCKCHHNLRWLVKFFQSCSSYWWQRCREGVKNLQRLLLVVHHILAPPPSTLNPLVHKLTSCCGHDIVTIDIHNSLCYCRSWVVKYLQVAEYSLYTKYTKYVKCRLVTTRCMVI